MNVELVERTVTTENEVSVRSLVFETLPDLGLDRMTQGQVELVMCASALTAQV